MSSIILDKLGVSQADINTLTSKGLAGSTGGEFYFSQTSSLGVSINMGIIGQPFGSKSAGGSLRRVNGLCADFISFDGLTLQNAENAVNTMQQTPQGNAPSAKLELVGDLNHPSFYVQDAVLGNMTSVQFLTKAVEFLKYVDSYARSYDKRVANVSASLSVADKNVLIVRADGRVVQDQRPVCQLSVATILQDGTKKESGSVNFGLPMLVQDVFQDEALWASKDATWQQMVHEAVAQASNNLTATEIKGGHDYKLVVGGGWGGVILHEAFGHGLEGDFHRKNMAAFQGMIGQRIAAKGVNIYDDGTVQDARGSYNFDDEGNPTGKNLLVEDGILVGLMTDEISAAALGMKVTGNGRRESYDHMPMPRMTNTFMANGTATHEELISDVKKGLYVTQFGGGQVDITSGKFEFNTTQARIIENGKLGAYVKGASLFGMGKDAFMSVSGVANNLELSKLGNCGKDGQSVPVTVGQPDILIEAGAIGVGGTA